MLWAIDVGNTQTVIGIGGEGDWKAVWRIETSASRTEDELAATLSRLAELEGLPFRADGAILASVVPGVNSVWAAFCQERIGAEMLRLTGGEEVGISIAYDPPSAVGADRIANALAGAERYGSPLIVADFGTATTLDVIDKEGVYQGGVIMPGLSLALSSLAGGTAKLPSVSLDEPPSAIGRTTPGALQSGIVLGAVCAVDGLIDRIDQELEGDVTLVATGGLGSLVCRLSSRIDRYEPNLTLDGLAIAHRRLSER